MYFFIVSLIMIVLIYFIEFKRMQIKSSIKISFLDSFKNNFSFVKMICISFIFISLFFYIVINLERGGFISHVKQEFSISYVPYIIYSVLVVPFIEEYFYRFLPFSLKKFNNIFMYAFIVIVSNLLFSYFHNYDIFLSVLVFFVGVIFSIIYLKYKNIIYTIFVHSLYNLIVNLRLYFIDINNKMCLLIFAIFLLVFLVYRKKFSNLNE